MQIYTNVPNQQGRMELFYIFNDRSIYIKKTLRKRPNGNNLGRPESSGGFLTPPTPDFSSTPYPPNQLTNNKYILYFLKMCLYL